MPLYSLLDENINVTIIIIAIVNDHVLKKLIFNPTRKRRKHVS